MNVKSQILKIAETAWLFLLRTKKATESVFQDHPYFFSHVDVKPHTWTQLSATIGQAGTWPMTSPGHIKNKGPSIFLSLSAGSQLRGSTAAHSFAPGLSSWEASPAADSVFLRQQHKGLPGIPEAKLNLDLKVI